MQLGEYSLRAKVGKTTRNTNCVSHYSITNTFTNTNAHGNTNTNSK